MPIYWFLLIFVFNQAWGNIAWLLTLPEEGLERGLFKMSALVSLGFALAGMPSVLFIGAKGAAWSGLVSGSYWTFFGLLLLYLGCLFVFVWPVCRVVLAGAAAAGGVCVVASGLAVAHLHGAAMSGALLLGAGGLCSGLLLGAVMVGMNVGHWYLLIPTLPVSLLGLMNKGLLGALALRAAVLGVAWVFGRSLLPADGQMFFTVRCIVGLAAPMVITAFVATCIRLKKEMGQAMGPLMAATGLFYVQIILVWIGELMSLFLIDRTSLPF